MIEMHHVIFEILPFCRESAASIRNFWSYFYKIEHLSQHYTIKVRIDNSNSNSHASDSLAKTGETRVPSPLFRLQILTPFTEIYNHKTLYLHNGKQEYSMQQKEFL